MRRLFVIASVLAAALCACDGGGDAPAIDGGGSVEDDAEIAPIDASDPPLVDGGLPPASGVAPLDTIPGEESAESGDVEVDADAGRDGVVRVEVLPGEHVTFFLSFEPAGAAVELEVLRWDGDAPVHVGLTDAGGGLRTLAVVETETDGARTFWARVTSDVPFSGTLAITRVPYEDGATCESDCARLLQLPLPIDPEIEGYAITSGTVLRYQYGRRDLVMMIRHAGRAVAALGMAPFLPEDLSQWNGETPGNDVGSPRHASHQRGKDVDISLYGLDGRSEWRSYCEAVRTSDGRECTAGSIANYDGVANAIFFGDFFATGRVTMCFLDGELIPTTVSGAEEAASIAMLDAALVPLYSDGRHLQHWPNHDNHIHVRVSEEPDGASAFVFSIDDHAGADPIEPP